MRILFVITPDDDHDKYILKLGQGHGIYVPLGIAQIAAVLEKEHQVRVLDLRLGGRVKAAVRAFAPDFIGFSISFFSAGTIQSLCRRLKQEFTIPINVGGQYAELYHQQILDCGADVIAVGEGDYTIANIIRAYPDMSKISGIIYRKRGITHNTGVVQIISDLDSLPYPAMHLFDVKRYIPLPKNFKRLPCIPVITSRGCPWARCIFCNQSSVYRRHSPEYIVDLIKYYREEHGAREIRFWDDSLVDHSDWIFRFCRLLNKSGLNVIWSAHARVSTVTRQSLSAMKKAGCWQVMYGIESGDQNLVDYIDKGTTLNDARRAVAMAKHTGLEVRASFILGIPGETPELADKTIRFAQMLGADLVQFSYFTPYPGTRAYGLLKDSYGLSHDPASYREYRPVFVPQGYRNRLELETKMQHAYRLFYMRPSYIIKSMMNISSSQDLLRYYLGFKVMLGMAFKRN